ncbi:MAG: glycosyltransferase family 2 protein [Bacteroidales bacterium]
MIKVAVVLLNWNGVKLFDKFLPSVLRHSLGDDIGVYVADNGSDDSSIEYLNANYPTVKIIENDKNHGFAEGYNVALRNLDAEYFVLLNTDVEVADGWISPIISLMDRDTNIAACQPKIMSYHKKNYFEHAGAAGGYIDRIGYPFCRGRVFDFLEEDLGQHDELSEIFWASGAAMFVRSSAYWEVGGLDGDFFAHMEEIDLCWRLKRLGYSIYSVPQSRVYHLGGGTLPYASSRKLYLNFRNSLFMLYKNASKGRLFISIATKSIIDSLSFPMFLLKADFGGIKALFRAYWHFLLSLGKLRAKRKAILRQSKVERVSEIYEGFIAIDFFIRRKKIYIQYKGGIRIKVD